MEEIEGSGAIARSLEEGWDYSPGWRCQVVEQYLATGIGIENPLHVLADENDAYVRQLFLLRRTGGCLSRESFLWAYRCHANNRKTGAASLVKAMAVAKYPVPEIAARLRTTTKSIAIFMKLFFDIVRYRDDREWLATVIFPTGGEKHDLSAIRERRWLAAAFLNGQKGLERSLSRKIATSPEERDQLTAEIRGILTARTHEFVADLQNNCTLPNGDDFDRFVRLLDSTARQPLPDNRDSLMQAFVHGLHSTLGEKAKFLENANDPVLQELREAGMPDVLGAQGVNVAQNVGVRVEQSRQP